MDADSFLRIEIHVEFLQHRAACNDCISAISRNAAKTALMQTNQHGSG